MPFVPDHMAAPSEGGGILPTQAPLSSAEAATAAPSSCSHGRGKQRAHLLCLIQEGLSLEMQLMAQTGVWPEPQS